MFRKKYIKRALLIIDPQNDFCPGGALAVSECNQLIKKVNAYIGIFSRQNFPVFVSRDWHPDRTRHFKEFGGSWPVHCVQNTKGAMFHPGLKLPKEAIILSKGMNPDSDGYSVFESADLINTSFTVLLKLFNLQELYIGGLSTDYCIRNTALAALNFGLKVVVLVDAIRGVDVNPGDSEWVLEEMLRRGAKAMTLPAVRRDVSNHLSGAKK